MTELVPVAAFQKPSDAHLARMLLESYDIPTVIVGEHSMNMNQLFAFYPGVCIRLLVRDQDAAKAREVLQLEDSNANQLKDESCPNCESNEVKRYFSDHRTLLAFSYLFAPLFILIVWCWRWRRCLSCGHRWKP